MPSDRSEGSRGDLRGWFHAARSGGPLRRLAPRGRFVVDRREHLAGAVTAPVVVGVDEKGDLPAGLLLGGEVPAGQQLMSSVEFQLSAAALSSAEPTRPIDWVTPSALQASGEHVAGVLAALVGVEHHAVDVAAAHRGGHAQRRPRHRGVVVLTEREARHAPRREIQHGGEVELALVGGDLGQVPAPALIDRVGVEVPFHQVRDRRRRLVRAGQAAPLAFRGPARQALAGHRRRHRVDRHPPAGFDEVLEHSGRPVGARRATRVIERRLDRRVQLGSAPPRGRWVHGRATCRTTTRSPPTTGSTSRGAPGARSSGRR